MICSCWKIKYILFKTSYPNINISVEPFKLCCRSANSQTSTGFLKYLSKVYGSFKPKIVEKINLSKSVSGYFKTKKKILLQLSRGEWVVKALTLKNIFFCGFPKMIKIYLKKCNFFTLQQGLLKLKLDYVKNNIEKELW